MRSRYRAQSENDCDQSSPSRNRICQKSDGNIAPAQPLAHNAGADDRRKKYGCSEAFRREFASERHQRVLAMNSKWDRSSSSPLWREQMHS